MPFASLQKGQYVVLKCGTRCPAPCAVHNCARSWTQHSQLHATPLSFGKSGIWGCWRLLNTRLISKKSHHKYIYIKIFFRWSKRQRNLHFFFCFLIFINHPSIPHSPLPRQRCQSNNIFKRDILFRRWSRKRRWCLPLVTRYTRDLHVLRWFWTKMIRCEWLGDTF